ncbi:MAG: hypothetical protein U0791_18495 [Gemmataceae bacterium]
MLRIRLDGAQFHDVFQFAAEKEWGLSERQVRNYMRKADDLLVERMDRGRKRIIAQHLSRREALYARAVNAADYRTALAILTDSAKLQSLYASERDLRELVKLAAGQDLRIRDLENRLYVARQSAGTRPPEHASVGPDSGRGDGQPAGPAGEVQGGPGPTDD